MFIDICLLKGRKSMKTITALQAKTNLYKIIDEASSHGEPILITGRRSNAVLLSENDWNSIQETLFLVSIPGMRESIIMGMKVPINKCSDKLLF